MEEASPCLILLDELVSYLVKLKFSNSRRSQNLYRQTVQFLQETLQLAGNVPGVCILLSLPKSKREFGGIDPAQLQHELEVLDELQPRADRVVSKRTPVNDDEIYRLTRQRLFQNVDEDAARRVARAYREVYEKTPGSYDPAVTTDDYLRRMEDAWPLHPELLDVIYKKWSTASDFPRTRATLQLLASVVADQWRHRRDAHAIQPAHVDLERERIRTRIVSAAGAGGGYDGVVAADIVGGDGHANREDERRGGDYARLTDRARRGDHPAHALVRRTDPERRNHARNSASARSHRTSDPSTSAKCWTRWRRTSGTSTRKATGSASRHGRTSTASSRSGRAVSQRLPWTSAFGRKLEQAIGAPHGFRTLAWAGSQRPDSRQPRPHHRRAVAALRGLRLRAPVQGACRRRTRRAALGPRRRRPPPVEECPRAGRARTRSSGTGQARRFGRCSRMSQCWSRASKTSAHSKRRT